MSVDLSKSPVPALDAMGTSGRKMMTHIGAMGKVQTAIGSQQYDWLRRNDLDALHRVFMFDYS